MKSSIHQRRRLLLQAKGKVLVTTLLDARQYSKLELAIPYKSRWHVELDIRHIKEALGVNIVTCKTPEMAEKEIWTYLLVYNLLRMLMAQSASIVDVHPRHLSFKHCLQLWLSALPVLNDMNDIHLAKLFLLMSEQRVGNRAERIEPHAVKRRPKA